MLSSEIAAALENDAVAAAIMTDGGVVVVEQDGDLLPQYARCALQCAWAVIGTTGIDMDGILCGAESQAANKDMAQAFARPDDKGVRSRS